MTTEERESDALDEIRTLMRSGDVRIELGFSLSIKGAHPTAQLYRRSGNRWVEAGPLLTPREGGTHADLLDMLAELANDDDR
jgi:hypothetical protein